MKAVQLFAILVIELFILNIISIIAYQPRQSATFQQVKHNAKIVGLEPFFNQTTFSLTECFLECRRQPEKCSFVEVKNANEAWSCRLFSLNSTYQIENYLKSSPGSDVSSIKPDGEDCVDLKKRGFKDDGVYNIRYNKWFIKQVYCDMTTDGGGWIVIQNRFDGSVEFYGGWTFYRDGFGDAHGELWMGNEFVHQYTETYPKQVDMMVEGIMFDDTVIACKLKNFKLSDEASKYKLDYDSCTEVAGVQGETHCGDWNVHNGMKFTTIDNNNGMGSSCAASYAGDGWWFNSCQSVNFNGKYSKVEIVKTPGLYLHWKSATTYLRSFRSTRMLIRRTQ